ncbi:MAG: glycosyltransferase family 4 protein [Lacunisphaera sp.]
MKVLLVSEPGVDGVFRFVESLAHYLLEQQVEVHYAYSDRRGSDRLQPLVDCIRAHGGRTFNLATGNGPALADLRAFRGLHTLVREAQPDIIHSHSSKAGVLARGLKAFGVKTPQIYQPHAYSGMRPRAGLNQVAYDGVERVLGRWSTTINISSDEFAYALGRLRLPAGRAIWLTNGIDTDHFRPVGAAEKAALRRRLGLRENARVLGIMGRAAPQKDPLTAYRAFAAALLTDPNLVLFHVGRGELDSDVDRFIADHNLRSCIVRLPYLSTPVDFYRAIDGFILSSLYEGMSLAALEALACDLPLIVSDAPGNRELGKLPLSHLWIAPIGDVTGFARAILEWAAGRDVPSTHRTCATWHFNHRQTFANILALYRRLQQTNSPDHSPLPPLRPQPSSS